MAVAAAKTAEAQRGQTGGKRSAENSEQKQNDTNGWTNQQRGMQI